MANYIKDLQEKNRLLQEKLDQIETEMIQLKKEAKPYEDLAPELDGRNRLVKIVYGANAQTIHEETLPLQQAFDKLVSFYSAFAKPTDRNVPRGWTNPFTNNAETCNQEPCYIKKTFKDMRSGQTVENLRKEVPLWLAVDDVVQKEQNVQLITIKEFDDFYKEEMKKELRTSRAYVEKQRQAMLEQVMQEG